MFHTGTFHYLAAVSPWWDMCGKRDISIHPVMLAILNSVTEVFCLIRGFCHEPNQRKVQLDMFFMRISIKICDIQLTSDVDIWKIHF
jgi:hypothetical protein